VAIPNSKATLKSWCKRKLGHPVIEVNVDDDQIDDRIDEALQYFAQFHFDGVERMYLKYQVTADDVTRAEASASTSATDDSSSVTASWKESTNYLPIPDTVLSVLQVFPFSNTGSINMFDVRYQMRLNDLYDFSSTSVVHYEMTMQHLDFLDHILVGEKPVRYNVHQNRLYIDMDWGEDIDVGEYLVIECWRKLDPTVWTDVYNDFFLKRYAASLIKKQWGQNLIKFNGVTMLGGVTINGETIYTQAQEEIDKLEEEMRLTWEMPIDFAVG
jgi:hypothetical protein|tara:strand:- start:4619 stop:5431 length:813 start_codon:yes stop_codon:yes gene_type:complete